MSNKSRISCRKIAAARLAACLVSLGAAAVAQQFGFSAASIEPHSGVSIAGAGEVRVPIAVRVRRGYHINSNRPNEPYLIPTSLSWDDSPFVVESVDYPPAEEVQYDFSDTPLAVYSSRIEIVTTFRVASPPEDLRELRGLFRFQACNDKACLPPRTIPVSVPVRQ